MSVAASSQTPEISVVIPVCNEVDNVGPLAREIVAALQGKAFEILFVDDGSTDGTADAVRELRDSIPQLRLLRHSFRSGQSAAVCSGVRHARAEWIATLDGDGQNDPADIPKLYDSRFVAELVMGNRVQRRDTWLRHAQSRVANGVRGWLLGDGTPDTGCGIKVMQRAQFLELPRFDHMHRFLPALFLRAGARVVSVPVAHRPRARGTSKYGLFDRLWVGIVDIFGVMWLRRRFRPGLQIRED
ncbi:MAG: glycosyltransferase family 2 protein [Gammaproteobacteria bacterium]|jgi:dolichol-phosphate mannosyltransferase|nr:glycosyltransferase family 2 protein [Gammaproteobacteria bacterium]NBR16723.1 glycosyltransferase family 2 protein [Gammaproteobacteria bacterium]NCW20686.1 glycosyltransferase family 2 protein [Gammaproteobacteria bacterium]NCW57100.1 glycosyltransferase family 2 protein [Gammaproteobacteria bacterium]NDA43533.1 glycosyltransferase family 2 protein [Gammaproteobacteria bacterium]